MDANAQTLKYNKLIEATGDVFSIFVARLLLSISDRIRVVRSLVNNDCSSCYVRKPIILDRRINLRAHAVSFCVLNTAHTRAFTRAARLIRKLI